MRSALFAFLLVAVLPKPLLPLVSSNLMALALTTGGHKVGGQGNRFRAYKGRHRQRVFQMPVHMLPRYRPPPDSTSTSINSLFTLLQGARRTRPGRPRRPLASNHFETCLAT